MSGALGPIIDNPRGMPIDALRCAVADRLREEIRSAEVDLSILRGELAHIEDDLRAGSPASQ